MLDQHFMTDTALLSRIVEYSGVTKEDVVLEIGAGTGNLTKLLAKKCKKVEVIEVDKELFDQLKKDLVDFRNISYTHDNAMQIKFPHFTKCVSNLPYTLCETLLWKFTRYHFDSLTLVVPKNFADLLKNSDESRLYYLAETFYNIEYLEEIYPYAFDPQPRVVSELIRITPKKTNTFLRKFLIQYDKKTKNAIRDILMEEGMTKQEANGTVLLKLRKQIQDKNIINLSLNELQTIMRIFEK